MFSKCACCDQRNATIYVASSDDMYCGMCHAEQFYYADFDEGYQMGRGEIDSGDFDTTAAVMSFEADPPDCARHWGFLQACLHQIEIEKENENDQSQRSRQHLLFDCIDSGFGYYRTRTSALCTSRDRFICGLPIRVRLFLDKHSEMRKINPIARALLVTNRRRPQTVPDKKKYNRKKDKDNANKSYTNEERKD